MIASHSSKKCIKRKGIIIVITKLDKQNQVQALSDCMQKAKAYFLVHFQGINADQVTQFRKELKKNDGEMKVFRNTLLKKALGTTSVAVQDHLTPTLTGCNAFVFAFKDPSAVAKIVTNYVKKTKKLQIKTGIMDGAGMTSAEVKHIAHLPSLDVLKAQFLAVLSGVARNFVSVLGAVPSGFLRTVSAYKKQQEKQNNNQTS